MTEIEKLQSRLIESDQMYQQLKKQLSSPRNAKNSTSTVGRSPHYTHIYVIYYNFLNHKRR